jgi:hypothetical protein
LNYLIDYLGRVKKWNLTLKKPKYALAILLARSLHLRSINSLGLCADLRFINSLKLKKSSFATALLVFIRRMEVLTLNLSAT